MSRDACIALAEQAGLDSDELVEWWSERAAVREYDGGQARDEAELAALDDVRQMIELGPWIVGERRGPRSAAPTADVEVELRHTQK